MLLSYNSPQPPTIAIPQPLKPIQQSKRKILPNIWLLKRRRDSIIEGFGIIDIIVAVAIVIVTVKVEFWGFVVAPVVSGLILGPSRVRELG